MERVTRKRKIKPSQSGHFYQLTSKFLRGERKVCFRLPPGMVGTLTQHGGTISLVNLSFCQRECRHFQTRRSLEANFPVPPPPREPTVARRLLADGGPRDFHEREVMTRERIEPPPTSRPRRGLDDDEDPEQDLEIFYTTGYRRPATKTKTTFGEDDSVEMFVNRLASYHLGNINKSYSNLLETPLTIEMAIERVAVKSPSKAVVNVPRGRVSVTLPANFSFGMSERFMLDQLGFSAHQISTFKPAGQSQPVYGFVNNLGKEATFVAERLTDPAVKGKYVSSRTAEIGSKFRLGTTTQRKVCHITVHSESFVPSYSKKVIVPRSDLAATSGNPKELALLVVSIFAGILDDVTSELKLDKTSLVCTLQERSVYLRSRLAGDQQVYPNLTLRFQMKTGTAAAFGVTDPDIRWDCVSNLGLAVYNIEPVESVVTGDLSSPVAKRMSKRIRASPKKASKLFYDEEMENKVDADSMTVMKQFLADDSPIDADRLEDEKLSVTQLQELETAIRHTVRGKEEEEAAKAKQKKAEEAEKKRLKLEQDRLAKQAERQRAAEAERQRVAEANRVAEVERQRLAEEERQRVAETERVAEAERQRVAEEERQRVEELARQARINETRRAEEAFRNLNQGGRAQPEEVQQPEVQQPEVQREPEVQLHPNALDVLADPNFGPLDPAGLLEPPRDVTIQVPNPAPILPPNFECLVDNPFVGHADFDNDDEYLVASDYAVVFEEGVRADYIEGIGSCCVLAYARSNVGLDKKFLCEYPEYWDGSLTLSLYDNHQSPVSPANDCLSVLSIIVNHFERN